MADKIIVLITGCSSGIGLATAELLGKDSDRRFRVYATMRDLLDKNKGPLESAVGGEGAGILGETLFIRELDVSKDGDQQGAVDAIIAKEGRIDVLVNNAGINSWDSTDTPSIETCQEVFDVNFWGVSRMMRAVLPSMKERRSGRIINTTSIYTLVCPPFQAYYTASKFAVDGMTQSMAPLLKLYNIWAILVQPGIVLTEMTKGLENPIEFVTNTPKMAGFDSVATEAFVYNATREPVQKMVGAVQVPDQVASVIKEAVLCEKPKLWYRSSEFVEQVAASKLVQPEGDGIYDLLSPKQ
ncbi:retinol dehydrogenase 8-like [Asterias rubens]|uniref:retinol dehydrogenase 8-like n=1 Tax=Asterias rubens TaxID=7604 RepID=UPI00145517CC|nr:retinol dehydrogenase 8-like [Asterias rubens]